MNKEEFFKKFEDLNPKPLWEINGFTREGEKKPAFVLKAYAINGYIVIIQDWGEDGMSFYYPDMNNNWAKTFDALTQISKGVKPYNSLGIEELKEKVKRTIWEHECEFAFDGNVYVNGELYGKEEEFWQDRDDGKFKYIHNDFNKEGIQTKI